ncbi:MAG: DUF1579 domain-containing protein [Acidobacteriota bacterium]
MKIRGLAFLLLLTAVSPLSPVMAQDQKANGTPGEAEMTAAMMKAAQPGEQHKHLARYVGDWEYTSKMWMMPGQPAAESKGTMHGESMMDGRYVQHHWKGTFSGMPFEGLGTEAYDNTSKEYLSTWIDNVGTGIMMSTGSCDAAGKVCTQSNEMVDPMSGQKMTMRSVITWADNDHFKNEMFAKDPSGNEMKTMEITAWRKK